MAWEKFKRIKPGKKSLYPAISIIRYGASGIAPMYRIAFNKSATLQFNLGVWEYCDLYFNPETKQIGVRVGPSGEYKISNRNNNPTSVSVTSFIHHYGIEPTNSIPVKKEGNMIVTKIGGIETND